MRDCRALFALGLTAFVFAPLFTPFREMALVMVQEPKAMQLSPDDADRLRQLGLNTLALTAGTLAAAVPLGVGLAVLLFRTSFFGRRFLLFVLAILLFIPLPVLVSSWQGFFGPDGFLPSGFWRNAEGRPWVSGLGAAIWIHSMAAVPWVGFIVGLGLTWVEPELEDEAAQSVGPWRVLLMVTLPRTRASIMAAGLFVALQTAGEVSVTEMMQVSTLAEETRAQFERGDGSGLARTLLISLPGLLLVWGAVTLLASRLERMLPPLVPPSRGHRLMELGTASLRLIVCMTLLIALAAPLASLIWKLGLVGIPPHWDAATAWRYLHAETVVNGVTVLKTMGTALVGGALIAGIALIGCWLARESRWFRWLLFGVSIWAWVIPASVVGIGLKELIQDLVESWPTGPVAASLYFAPSPLPVMWAQGLRVLPIAVVFFWPVVRMIPRELFDEARLGGAGAFSECLHVVGPMAWRAAVVTALACTALCLAEIAASGRVETAGWKMFMGVLFERMHRGADNTVAALSLLMLGGIFGLALIAMAIAGTWRALVRR
jgi:iron(III) transport system permease protein